MHVCSVYPVAAQNWQRPFWRFVQVIYKVVFANADSVGPKVTVANCYETPFRAFFVPAEQGKKWLLHGSFALYLLYGTANATLES